MVQAKSVIGESRENSPEAGPSSSKPWGVYSWRLSRNRTVPPLMGGALTYLLIAGGAQEVLTDPRHLQGILGWGRKRSAVRGKAAARNWKLPFFCLEDGFIRSLSAGKSEPGYSLVVDDQGIYYDACHPSRLEQLAKTEQSGRELARAAELCRLWRENRVSKYNASLDYSGPLPERFVLAADQTAGDLSIQKGWASAESFHRMLEAALEENPGSKVLLKVHPEVWSGKKRGHFDLAELRKNNRIFLLGEDVHPSLLLERAEKVYTVTSQIGFEGLLHGKEVRTFGMPFYGGWGLTGDDLAAPDRRRKISREALVHAALIGYSRYLDPESGRPCEAERLVEWMGLQRSMRGRFGKSIFAFGFSPWKKGILKAFLQGSSVHYVDDLGQAPEQETLAVWSGKVTGEMKGRNLVRVEDGFIRSVGLGAELVRPLSWVFDRSGIYYDATGESDLERILAKTKFSSGLSERAQSLRERITTEGFTKYNIGSTPWKRPAGKDRVLLVTGQVESDASIRLGSSGIRSNQDLLKNVRQFNPGAHELYKPHPDVAAKLRAGGFAEGSPLEHCDEILGNVSLPDIFSEVDEVHVLTSLSGFEALLRGIKVVTYGQPFFAGWGLTEDRGLLPAVAERRKRRLKLDELVAGTLILYPTYVSRSTGFYSTPERALDEIAAWKKQEAQPQPLVERARRRVMRWFSR